MAVATISKQTVTPETPASGFAKFYFQGTSAKYIDDTGTVYTLATGISPEEVQDIVAGFITSSSTINWVYNDAGDTLTGTVVVGAVDHNALLNYVSNQHIDHSTVNITAGAGLTGGGDITTSRSISMPNVGTPGTFGSSIAIPVITTDAQGRVSAASTSSNLTPSAIGAQPADSDLTALAGLGTQGFIIRTGAGTATTRSIVSGTGINVTNTDGIGGDTSIALTNTGVTALTYGTATQIGSFTVDAQGRLTSASSINIAIPSSQVTDFSEAVDDRVAALVVAGAGMTITYNDPSNTLTFASTITQYTDEQAQDTIASLIQNGTGISWSYNDAGNTLTPTVTLAPFSTTNLTEGSNLYYTDERAQDAVGTILTDTASIDFTYNDAGNTISAAVLPAGVNHNALQNYVANQHIDHSAVSISAGTGLTGGGDITTNRTLNLANTAVTPGTYGSTTLAAFTVDAQGRITSAVNGPALALGDQFEDFIDNVTFTTGATTDQVAATFTTSTKPPGRYRIGLNWTWSMNVNNQDAIQSIYVDSTLVDDEMRQEISETANQRIVWSRFVYVDFVGNTTHTIQLRVRNEAAGATQSVFNVRAEIWRMT